MYLNHFGLQTQPFNLTPDSTLFFSGSERGAALEALLYAIDQGAGITKVIGEVGTGKTMLCHMLADQRPQNTDIIYLTHPSLDPTQMLIALALELGIPANESWSKIKIIQAFMQHLLLKHTHNRHVVALIDEAQSMPLETLEEMRLLSNLETGHTKLLQLVLFGQPELDVHLNQHRIRQLRERIQYHFYLKPFTQAETGNYLHHRLNTAGYRGSELFSQEAIGLLAKYSKGLARRINLLADKAMMIAYSENRNRIAKQDIVRALPTHERESHTIPIRSWCLVGTLYLSLGALLYQALI